MLPLNPLYQFDQTRVTINGSPAPIGAGSGSTVAVPVYSPADAQKTPYLYFAAQNYSTQPGWTGTQGDKCLPYLLDNGPNLNAANPYANPSTFQIISAGLDGSFGNAANWTGTPGANGYSFTASLLVSLRQRGRIFRLQRWRRRPIRPRSKRAFCPIPKAISTT